MHSFTKVVAVLSCVLHYAAAFSGDMTYYTPGLGSCGQTNSESDAVVALSPSQYAADPQLCGKKIQIHMGGKTAVATVVDKCPGCSSDSIDVSPTVFQELSPLTVGRVKVEWDFTT
ncbi:RlpA-like double-psi beta-barrel-protein domain-containing protein-containing protein [Daldinia caldariorum]|uniref:RlpA-like double-psi beta-barrel-protein domain-containing protein-containing protein n=1 Tax=Daldinia caldariorum TaxID=326644 RepID=UPI0020078010|nr:RlpA-like double-psi beta-barrel-protein domain-containing protein-containing protein [Daldinia caldariorum]KAI1472612.1 RlpA-like double-psi beta-barrel-protein domain-containing protein-containing protein [Daldinia caldariorum]